jgi:hypothetical protein
MNVPTRWTSLSAITALLCAPLSVAGESDQPTFTFNGYGTFGVVHSTEDQADFTTSSVRPHGVGYSRQWSVDVDSLMAAQINADFTSRLSAVVQLISEQNYDGTYRPQVEWANVKFQFTPDFSARVGRVALPVFQVSESRKVGLTYPWVRPPTELYHLSPVSNADGLDVAYRMHFGEWTNTLQAMVGEGETKLPDNQGSARDDDLWVISSTAELGALSAHVAYARTDVSLEAFDQLFDAYRQLGDTGIAFADRNDVEREPVTFLGISATYDPGKWFAMAEYGEFKSDSVLGNRTAWYLTGGYRLGKFTTHLTYSVADADELSSAGLDVTNLPSFLVAPVNALNAAYNAILSTRPVENTVSVGARWDVMPNVALKLQFDHTDVAAGSTGVLINTQPGFELGDSFTLFSATIDFVF